jgi:hypothetical protein
MAEPFRDWRGTRTKALRASAPSTRTLPLKTSKNQTEDRKNVEFVHFAIFEVLCVFALNIETVRPFDVNPDMVGLGLQNRVAG